MNTVFRDWYRALRRKPRLLVLGEMLCLIAVASAFLITSPLAHGEDGDGGCACNGCAANGCAANGCAANGCAEGNENDDDDNGCANACASVPANASSAGVTVVTSAGAKPSKAALKRSAIFQSIITTLDQNTSPTGPNAIGMTAQMSGHMTFQNLQDYPWITVTLNVNGKTATFAATAFLNRRAKPSVWLAEILPPSNPNDPGLKALIGQTVPLVGIR